MGGGNVKTLCKYLYPLPKVCLSGSLAVCYFICTFPMALSGSIMSVSFKDENLDLKCRSRMRVSKYIYKSLVYIYDHAQTIFALLQYAWWPWNSFFCDDVHDRSCLDFFLLGVSWPRLSLFCIIICLWSRLQTMLKNLIFTIMLVFSSFQKEVTHLLLYGCFENSIFSHACLEA